MTKKYIFAIVILAIGLLGIHKSLSLKTNMDNKLFISSEDGKSLKDFENKFGKNTLLLISIAKPNVENDLIKLLETKLKNETLSFLSFRNFSKNKNYSSILIDINEDETSKAIEHLKQVESCLDLNYDSWYASGALWTNYQLIKENVNIQQKIFPAIFIFLGFLIYFFLRNIKISSLIFFLSLTSTGITFWIIEIIKSEIHLLTNLLPLMNFVLPMAISLHLYFGLLKYQTWDLCWKIKKKPILLASITTISGIASLSFSSINVIRDFAILGTISLIVNFLLTILIFKIFSLQISHWKHPRLQNKIFNIKFKKNNFSYPWLLFSVTISLVGLFYLTRLPILVEAENFFSKDHHFSESLLVAHQVIGGVPTAEILLEKNTIISYAEMRTIDKYLEQLKYEFNDITFISPMALIKNANLQYSQLEELPTFELSARTLYAQIPILLKKQAWQEKIIKITLWEKPNELAKNRIETILEKLKTQLGNEYQVSINGESSMIHKSQKELIQSLIMSFAISFCISCLIVFFYLKNFLNKLAFILVNIAPIALTILLFPLLKMQINMATVMSFSISFGLIVDGTIHLLFAKEIDDYINKPILLSSLLVILAFAPLALNGFLPIWQFGCALSLILFFGLFFDLYVLRRISKS